ncbi:MAG TPA: GAF domain-containing SpoIIE family protein phosphatase [Pirellulales bacterium]
MANTTLGQVDLAPDELARRLKAMANLLDVTQALAEELDVDRVLRAIAQEACEAADCERASFFQFDEERGDLFTRVATELEIAEIRSELGKGISGDVAQTRRRANVPNPSADPRWNSDVDRLTGYQTRNLLAMPILSPHGKRLLGVLQVINKRAGAFDDFDEQLMEAFAHHFAAALERAQFLEEQKRQQTLHASLDVAREIQRAFMPHELPQTTGYEFATWWFPNEAVGGDYCDVMRLRDGRIGLVVADVSGHGLGPALLMASVRAGLKALSLEHVEPETLLTRVGQSLAGDLQEGRFVTMMLAALDPVAHRLEFANAGHAPALFHRLRTGAFENLEATGMPLGILDDFEYPQGRAMDLEPGDLVVLCTDGIVEATDEAGRQFGYERLKALIAGPCDSTAGELARCIGAAVSEYYVGESPPDDLTVLVMRRLP